MSIHLRLHTLLAGSAFLLGSCSSSSVVENSDPPSRPPGIEIHLFKVDADQLPDSADDFITVLDQKTGEKLKRSLGS